MEMIYGPYNTAHIKWLLDISTYKVISLLPAFILTTSVLIHYRPEAEIPKNQSILAFSQLAFNDDLEALKPEKPVLINYNGE